MRRIALGRVSRSTASTVGGTQKSYDRTAIRIRTVASEMGQGDEESSHKTTIDEYVRYTMNAQKLGNGIQKMSARPMKVHVAKNGEVWYCDAEASTESGFESAGCMPLSESPQHK